MRRIVSTVLTVSAAVLALSTVAGCAAESGGADESVSPDLTASIDDDTTASAFCLFGLCIGPEDNTPPPIAAPAYVACQQFAAADEEAFGGPFCANNFWDTNITNFAGGHPIFSKFLYHGLSAGVGNPPPFTDFFAPLVGAVIADKNVAGPLFSQAVVDLGAPYRTLFELRNQRICFDGEDLKYAFQDGCASVDIIARLDDADLEKVFPEQVRYSLSGTVKGGFGGGFNMNTELFQPEIDALQSDAAKNSVKKWVKPFSVEQTINQGFRFPG